MSTKIRRVVTGHDDSGSSVVLVDGVATTVKELGTTQIIATDLWETSTMPVSNQGSSDTAARPVMLEPPPNGSIFRFVEFPPDEVWNSSADIAAAFESIGGIDTYVPNSRPMAHRSNTIDYVIILKGEITCVLDKGEAHLKAGDVLIQRGTNHSWSVRGKEPCLLFVVLLSASPVS